MRGESHHLHFLKQGILVIKMNGFYWQNADKTLTLVGIGHATVLTSEETENRFEVISDKLEKVVCGAYKRRK